MQCLRSCKNTVINPIFSRPPAAVALAQGVTYEKNVRASCGLRPRPTNPERFASEKNCRSSQPPSCPLRWSSPLHAQKTSYKFVAKEPTRIATATTEFIPETIDREVLNIHEIASRAGVPEVWASLHVSCKLPCVVLCVNGRFAPLHIGSI